MKGLNFKEIGLKIKERRKSIGITQEYIAELINENKSHNKNKKCKHANPSLTALVKIANILECSVDYFIGGEYTYDRRSSTEQSLDEQILEKLKYCDPEKKHRILKMIDLL